MFESTKKIVATLAGYPVLWLFSAFMHMVDGNLYGLEGFFTLLANPSVYVWAALLFVPGVVAVFGFWVRGALSYGCVLAGAALLIGLYFTIGGSTATSLVGYLISFGGMTLITALFLVPGTLPGVLYLRSVRQL